MRVNSRVFILLTLSLPIKIASFCFLIIDYLSLLVSLVPSLRNDLIVNTLVILPFPSPFPSLLLFLFTSSLSPLPLPFFSFSPLSLLSSHSPLSLCFFSFSPLFLFSCLSPLAPIPLPLSSPSFPLLSSFLSSFPLYRSLLFHFPFASPPPIRTDFFSPIPLIVTILLYSRQDQLVVPQYHFTSSSSPCLSLCSTYHFSLLSLAISQNSTV